MFKLLLCAPAQVGQSRKTLLYVYSLLSSTYVRLHFSAMIFHLCLLLKHFFNKAAVFALFLINHVRKLHFFYFFKIFNIFEFDKSLKDLY